MKMKNLFVGVLLILAVNTSEARSVYSAVVSEDLIKDVPNEESLKELIKVNDKPVSQYFSNKDYELDGYQTFVIIGGNESIRETLTPYKNRKIKHTDSVNLEVDICNSKKLISKNQTYVFIRPIRKRHSPIARNWLSLTKKYRYKPLLMN